MLEVELKIRRRTPATGKDDLKMFHGLQQRISVRTAGRRMLTAESCPQQIQSVTQTAPQPIYRFQRKGQPQFFDRSLEGKARQ